MFAPLVAQARSTGPQAHKDADQTHMARGRIGNQATSRFVAPQASRLARTPGAEMPGPNGTGRAAPLSRDFSKIPVNPPGGAERAQAPRLFTGPRLPLQRKLKVGSTDDPLEHEADRVADHVMRMPAPASGLSSAPPQVSRKCAACEEEEKLQKKEAEAAPPASGLSLAPPQVSRKCAACEEEKKLQKKEAAPSRPALIEAPPNVHETLHSSGQPLDAATRTYFEPRFGRDFSSVRLHTDPAAAQSARDVNAHAYTVGRNIVFDAGQFVPGSQQGRRLLAHELAHVVQQSGGTAAPRMIRRQARHGDCPTKGPDNPCAKYEEQGMIRPYLRPAKDLGGQQESAGLTTLEAVFGTDKGPVERAHLLRIACCRLEPEDAAVVKTAFEQRQGAAGKVFHELAPSTQCDLLWILNDRSKRAGASSVQAHQRDVAFQQAANRQRHNEALLAERDRERAAEEQFKQDKENLDKAGQIGILDVLMPAHTQPYRI